MAFLGPMLISITDISKFFKSCLLLPYGKYNLFYALPFSSKTSKIRIYEKKIFKLQFKYSLWFLINLINDDAFVSAPTADTWTTVHLVCLFMKTHRLALLQDNCLDVVHCAFLRKLSAFCQHLLRQIKAATLADTNISVKPKYRPGQYIGHL